MSMPARAPLQRGSSGIQAHAVDAVLLPGEDVHAWLQAWATPDEAAADLAAICVDPDL
jgi:hypothetical protein